MPNDPARYCPSCSDAADKAGNAPLVPGLVRPADGRQPLNVVSADVCAKGTRFASAGKAQLHLKPVKCELFGEANDACAACSPLIANGDDSRLDESCGSRLRCVKAREMKSGGVIDRFGVGCFACEHGCLMCGTAWDCESHGAHSCATR